MISKTEINVIAINALEGEYSISEAMDVIQRLCNELMISNELAKFSKAVNNDDKN